MVTCILYYMYNALAEELRNVGSTKLFKKKKQHLLQNSFYSIEEYFRL